MNPTPEAWARLGRALRDARAQRGWTQQDLANHAGVSRRSVQDAEGGKVPKGRMPQSIPRIAATLGWSTGAIDAVLAGEDHRQPHQATQPAVTPSGDREDARVRAIDALWETLTPDERRQQLRRLQREAEQEEVEQPPYPDMTEQEWVIWEMDMPPDIRRTMIDVIRDSRQQRRKHA